MKLLDKQQVSELSLSECQRLLEQLQKYYDFDTPLISHPKKHEVDAYINEIVNMFLYLEDRINYLDFVGTMATARGAALPEGFKN